MEGDPDANPIDAAPATEVDQPEADPSAIEEIPEAPPADSAEPVAEDGSSVEPRGESVGGQRSSQARGSTTNVAATGESLGSRAGSRSNLVKEGSNPTIPATNSRTASRTDLNKPSAEKSTVEAEKPKSAGSKKEADAEAGPEKDLPAYEFLYGKDVYFPQQGMIPEDAEVALAKSFLMTNSEKSDINLYDHLTSVVMQVLEQRPKNVVDVFEQFSADVKKRHFKPQQMDSPAAFRPAQEQNQGAQVAKTHMTLFERPADEAAAVEQALQSDVGEIPDIMDYSKLWEWAGITFGKDETFLLFLSIKKLVQDKPLKSVRLWGKILGLNANYVVVEAELKDNVIDEEDEKVNGKDEDGAGGEVTNEPEAVPEGAGEEEVAKDGAAEADTLPKPKVKQMPVFHKEARSGVNKYVYYVCNSVGGAWMRLPDARPEHLQASRKIRKFMTGNLNTQIVSYPPFSGTEAHYLRCQIARISAASVVSPAGYYTFDPDEGDGDEPEQRTTIIVNTEFEGLSNESMLSLSNWVHHVPYILPQGRVIWENPYAKKPSGGEDGEDEDEEEKDNDEQEENAEKLEGADPEEGPPILSPLAGDEDHGDIPAWSARLCSFLSPLKFSPVMLRSNRWPGAFVVAYNDKFSNLYIGNGLKDLGNPSQSFIPPPLPEIQKEYGSGVEGALGSPDELVEQVDPTAEEEAAFEAEQKAKEEALKGDQEEEEEGGEEGEGDEED
ncbi:radial spokehead-like protein-domain-containing protein [Cladochytrium replicatum]|nr:radial spokehead-like protein-domain-containing protein [Cladochytrium replicatum]